MKPRSEGERRRRMMARVQIEPDGCWRWTGAKNEKGYGNQRVGDTVTRAHRAVWEALVGPCPPGKEFHHTCGVRACVNPAHGQWVDIQDHH